MAPEKHMKLLRASILGIACFAWLFSMLFPLNDYIFMFMALTGAIYLGGAGAVIIGGLYWKRATAAGAWTAMVTGSILGMTGVLTKNIFWPYLVPWLQNIYPSSSFIQKLPGDMPLNGQELAFCVAVICIALYITVSLCTKQNPDFDMDRMLHRGKYADEKKKELKSKFRKGWKAIFNITPEFSFWDKVLLYITTGWAFVFFGIFIIGTIYNLFYDVSDDAWAKWWLFYVIFIAIAGTIVLLLYIIGGLFDLRYMFNMLKSSQRDDADDGTVIHGHNLSDEK
jgi:SSS family solute:Na+ symporter